MKIEKLTVQRFRSLKDVTWEPGDLNVVIGPNASGKSNLLKALQVIAASAEGKLRAHIIRSGGMEPLLWDGSVLDLRFGVYFIDNTTPRELLAVNLLNYKVQILRLGNTGAYSIEGEALVETPDEEHNNQYSSQPVFTRRGRMEAMLYTQGVVLPIDASAIADDETLLSQLKGISLSGREAFDWRIGYTREAINGWAIFTEFDTSQDSEVRRASVSRHDTQLEPDGQNLVPVLHTLYNTDRDFKRNINLGMKAAFGDEFEEIVFPPADDQRVQLRVRWKSLKREQSTADLSDGTLRFLFLLTALASPVPPTLIAIDEPEIGLHPAMLPIVAEYAAEASQKTQVIFTTHSPQFLDAFRDTKPTVTVAKWENGETKLAIPDAESLSHWLQEYSLGTLFKTGELENMA